jgi:hypothetical protein
MEGEGYLLSFGTLLKKPDSCKLTVGIPFSGVKRAKRKIDRSAKRVVISALRIQNCVLQITNSLLRLKLIKL